MFWGNHCSLLGQIDTLSPICPGRVPQPPLAPAGWSLTGWGGQASGEGPCQGVVNGISSEWESGSSGLLSLHCSGSRAAPHSHPRLRLGPSLRGQDSEQPGGLGGVQSSQGAQGEDLELRGLGQPLVFGGLFGGKSRKK